MNTRNLITIKNIDIFLYMLREDKPSDANTVLEFDAVKYSRTLSNSNCKKLISAIRSPTQYSKVIFNLSQSDYNGNLKAFIKAAIHCPYTLELDFSYLSNEYTNELAQVLVDFIQNKHCPRNLTINLTNCNIKDNQILSFAKALSTGHCPVGLKIKFNNSEKNTEYSLPNSISNEGIQAIITALHSGKCPTDLQLDFTGNSEIDSSLLATMNSIIKLNNKIKPDVLRCSIFQHKIDQDKTDSRLPQEVADKVYEFLLPSQSMFKTLDKIREDKIESKPECCLIL